MALIGAPGVGEGSREVPDHPRNQDEHHHLEALEQALIFFLCIGPHLNAMLET